MPGTGHRLSLRPNCDVANPVWMSRLAQHITPRFEIEVITPMELFTCHKGFAQSAASLSVETQVHFCKSTAIFDNENKMLVRASDLSRLKALRADCDDLAFDPFLGFVIRRLSSYFDLAWFRRR